MPKILPVALTLTLLAACGGDESAREEPVTLDETPGGEEAAQGNEAPSSSGGELVVGEDACATDADCAPAVCCHASACVAMANAPDCTDAVCTMDCQSGTIDCGGGCLCHEGRCAARLSEAADMQVH